jgi:hypothetical protein
VNDRARPFRHIAADKAALYRAIMDTFAVAKRQFRLQLRPDEVQIEARWVDAKPTLDEIQQALTQLAEWGNLEAQPVTARVSVATLVLAVLRHARIDDVEQVEQEEESARSQWATVGVLVNELARPVLFLNLPG